MSITYDLTITNMNCYSKYNDLPMVVFDIQWMYKGTDGTYSSFITDRTSIPFNDSSEFKEYKDLTQDEVILWIQEYTDPSIFTEAEQFIAEQIDQMANPPILNPKLPWDNS